MCATLSQREQSPTLKAISSFCFACNDNIPCFTQCCRDVNIYLTPYDILRLRRSLRIGSTEFLAKYTRLLLGRGTHFPFFQFEMDPETLYCKLVTDDGCSVYENRPWACRMYPLDVADSPGEYTTVAGNERCLGLREPSRWVVQDWLENQGILPYVEMEKPFQSILALGARTGVDMDREAGDLLSLAYDLDRFVALLQEEEFRNLVEVDDGTMRQVLEDDEALLRLAFRYIRSKFEEIASTTPW